MRIIDNFLNEFTTYRLTLYFLIGLLFYSLVLSILSFLSYNPIDILGSVFLTVCSGYLTNKLFAKVFHASTNVESVFITALILSLIITPKLPLNWEFLIVASVLAMAVKYLPTIEKRHILNPAAGSVLAISLFTSDHAASWWVGTPWMSIPVLIGGLALVRKIRREDLFYVFVATFLVCTGIAAIFRTGNLLTLITTLQISFLKTPTLFFATVMLTEPLTSPTTKGLQKWYSLLVGIFYSTPQLRLFSIAFTPEQALILGNIFSFFITPNYRLTLSIFEKKQLSLDTVLFILKPVNGLKFKPGQYMEWMVPHKNTDSRGNRRYFSLASSPTEISPMLLVKFYTPSSSYKKALLAQKDNQPIIATMLAGDFTLPKNKNEKLVFIAGGVGIAPFRSMIKYLLDVNEMRDIVLIFINKEKEDIIFQDLFMQAQKIGLKTFYFLTNKETIPSYWKGGVGHLEMHTISQMIPDYLQRTFYASGPQLMVQSIEKTLKTAGVSKKRIKTDFFPGYSEKIG